MRTILAIRGEILNPLRYQLTTGTTIELATAVYAVPMVAMPKIPAFHSRKGSFSSRQFPIRAWRHDTAAQFRGTGQREIEEQATLAQAGAKDVGRKAMAFL